MNNSCELINKLFPLDACAEEIYDHEEKKKRIFTLRFNIILYKFYIVRNELIESYTGSLRSSALGVLLLLFPTVITQFHE